MHKMTIRADELRAALRPMKMGLRRKGNEALVSFDGARAVFEIPGAEVPVPASGTWEGQVRFPAHMLLSVMSLRPAKNELVIAFDPAPGKLKLGSLSVQAQRNDPPDMFSKTELPIGLDSSWVDILRVSVKYPRHDLVKSGLENRLEAAEERLRRKVERALEVLAELGVQREDLHGLVQHCLKRD